METSKNKDKRLEEKEKWDAEVARSLSVVELKKAHKQIEDVERLRKRDNILSIKDRIMSFKKYCVNIIKTIEDMKKKLPKGSADFEVGKQTRTYVTNGTNIYNSIRLDMERNIDVGKDNFDKLFPIIVIETSSYNLLCASLLCITIQLTDMVDYLKRLL